MGHTKAALYTAVDPTELQKDYGNPPFYHACSILLRQTAVKCMYST